MAFFLTCLFVRNITTRTCLKTSDAMWDPCLKDTCRTSHAVTLASSSTYMLSSRALRSARSPCSARTLILLIEPNHSRLSIPVSLTLGEASILTLYLYYHFRSCVAYSYTLGPIVVHTGVKDCSGEARV